MVHTFTEDDEGKKVKDVDGNTVGMISDVDHGTAYVDPDPGIGEKIMAKLGWSDRDEDDYPLQEEAIDRVDDDGVHLKRTQNL
jgi:hypothetical protein